MVGIAVIRMRSDVIYATVVTQVEEFVQPLKVVVRRRRADQWASVGVSLDFGPEVRHLPWCEVGLNGLIRLVEAQNELRHVREGCVGFVVPFRSPSHGHKLGHHVV